MPGLKTVIPATFTDLSLPKLRNDLVLPDQGALLLVDPAHSLSAWASGVPATSTKVPNLVQAQALAAVGSSTPDDVLSTFSTVGHDGTGKGLNERTPKGGLHVIHSQDPLQVPDDTSATAYTRLDIPLAIRNYLVTNMAHVFYASLWFRTTRAYKSGSSQNWIFTIANSTSSTGRDMIKILSHSPTTSILSYQNVGTRDDGTAAGAGAYGVRRAVTSGSGFRSTVPGTGSSVLGQLLAIGNVGTVNSFTSAPSGGPSGVFYRSYLEDLTLSGRTFAQAEAADAAAFEAAFGPGGRYNGDTVPTAPSTIP